MNCTDFNKLKTCPSYSCDKVQVVDFRKVVIPAVMGDDTGTYAPSNGAYHNALVEYEDGGHVYMYSSDGVYTLLNGSNGTSDGAKRVVIDFDESKFSLNGRQLNYNELKDIIDDDKNIVEVSYNEYILRPSDVDDLVIVFTSESYESDASFVVTAAITSTNVVKHNLVNQANGKELGIHFIFNSEDDISGYWKDSTSNSACLWKMPTGYYKANVDIPIRPYVNMDDTLKGGEIMIVENQMEGIPGGKYSVKKIGSEYTTVYYGECNSSAEGVAATNYSVARKALDSGMTIDYITDMVNNSTEDQKTAFKTALGIQ